MTATHPDFIELKTHSPCLGICSTTYGDQVCRGCKRYCHEIADWLRYQPIQKHQVWQRLEKTAQQVIGNFLRIVDAQQLQNQLQQLAHRPVSPQSPDYHALLLLHYLASRLHPDAKHQPFNVADYGLQWQIGMPPLSFMKLWQGIDQQLLALTIALYDRQIERPILHEHADYQCVKLS
jgi:hypothetical protein